MDENIWLVMVCIDLSLSILTIVMARNVIANMIFGVSCYVLSDILGKAMLTGVTNAAGQVVTDVAIQQYLFYYGMAMICIAGGLVLYNVFYAPNNTPRRTTAVRRRDQW